MSYYSEVMERTRNEVPEPKDVPVGTYRFMAISGKTFAPKDEDSNGGIMVVMQPIDAFEDVDAEELGALGDYTKERIFHRVFIDGGRAEWNAWAFLDLFGLQTDGRTFKDVLDDVKGMEIIGHVTHTPKKDGDGIWVNVKNFAEV